MSNLIVKYPTIWNMKKFILIVFFISLVFNTTYYLFFKYFHIVSFFGLISLLVFFYVVNIKDDEKKITINNFDIFDKININPFKEYLIVLILCISFFITIFISIYKINKRVPLTTDEIKIELLKYKKESNTTLVKEENKTIAKITSENKNSFLKSFKSSFDSGSKKVKLYMEKKFFSIKINKKTKYLLNSMVLKNTYLKYFIALFIIFIPIIFVLSNKNKGYYYNSFILYFWLFSVLINIFIIYEIINIQKYLIYIIDYKYVLIFMSIFLLLSFKGSYNILTKSDFKLNIEYAGAFRFLIAIFLLFLILNFIFKINIVLSTVVLILLCFISIGRVKELDNCELVQPKDI